MCGIAGLVHVDRRPVDTEVVRRMADTLLHRGPDAGGVARPAPHVGLGHRRLSIIDLARGSQPLSNEDGRIWITYNGEIFNYRELRDQLRAKGHVFSTESDTEVIVHLYEEEGEACVERLDGQFAFALWDGERLFCARDPLGIKPFYYLREGSRFAFGSEPRALLALPGWEPRVDLDALRLYFRYRFIPAPRSAFLGVRKLRSGETLTLHPGGRIATRRYWRLDPRESETEDDFESARRDLRSALEGAVAGQLVSDVPVGAFLSGGLDSSTIASLMSRAAEEPVHTFSIGFPPHIDERGFAGQVAEALGTAHHPRTIGPDEARELIPELLDGLDEPFGDPALLPNYAVSKLAREQGKVVLSGDGADELFAGYGRYYRALHLLAIPPPLRPFRRWIRRLQRPPRDPARWRYPDSPRIQETYHSLLVRSSQDELRRLFGPRLRERLDTPLEDPIRDVVARAAEFPPLPRVLHIDLESILSEYHLVKVDRASMLTSLEVRVPFLAKDFVEKAFRLSPRLRLYGEQSKGLLREAVRDLLPPDVRTREKQGFGPPLKHWFGGPLQPFVRERLTDSRAVSQGYLDRGAVEALLTPRRGRVDGSRLWRVLVLESWLRGLEEGRFTAPRA